MAERNFDDIVKEIKKLSEEARLKAHLASMDAKDVWKEKLEPTLKDVEAQIDDATKDNPVEEELIKLENQVRDFVNNLTQKT